MNLQHAFFTLLMVSFVSCDDLDKGSSKSELIFRPNGNDALSVSETFGTSVHGTAATVIKLQSSMKPAGRLRYDQSVTIGFDATRADGTIVGSPFGDGFGSKGLAADGFSTVIFYAGTDTSKLKLKILAQPVGRECTLSDAEIELAKIVPTTTFKIECTPLHRISGTITGLQDSATLTLKGFDPKALTVSGNNSSGKQSYSFEIREANWTEGSTVDVVTDYILALSDVGIRQKCSIANASGTLETWTRTMPDDFPRPDDGFGRDSYDYTIVDDGRPYVKMAAGDIVADITCESTAVKVGGTINDLEGTIVLMNGSDEVSVTSDTKADKTFEFSVYQPADYEISIKTQPTGQTCTIENQSGRATANVGNVIVTCTDNITERSIGGMVTGLDVGENVIIRDNISLRTFNVTADNSPYVFDLTIGDDYDIRIVGGTALADCEFVDPAKAVGTVSVDVPDIDILCD